MQNRLSRHRRALLSGSIVAALLLVAPAAVSAKPTISELRVEVTGTRALAPGHSFVNDTGRFRTDTRPACGGSGGLKTVSGPSALGILPYGSRVDRDLRPVGVSDQFDFGLFVCGIGSFVGDASKFWLFKVNHVSPQVGADQTPIKRGDKVLWYFVDTTVGSNVGSELELRGPDRARTGERVALQVVEYDAEGRSKPAAGVLVRGAGTTALTDANGRLTTGALSEGRVALRAYRRGDIPSELIKVCVNVDLSSCPAIRGEVIYGTQFADRIRGTRGADLVLAGPGDDYIDVRRNQRDRVRCGSGFDRVLASPNDRMARSCNKVVIE
jgi:uncharacterized protein DUF4430/hemolysin type calcium-binding protein